MHRGVIYIRYSSLRQGEGLSPARQRELGYQRAAEHHIDIVDVLDDGGLSAYHGLNWLDGAAGRFYAAYMAGQIERPLWFLVENFDRLDRRGAVKGMRRYLDLLDEGVTFLTTARNRVWTAADDIRAVIEPAIEFARAGSESRAKDDRTGKNWAAKNDKARTEGIARTKSCPGWFEVRDGRFHFIDLHRQTMIQIMEWTAAGKGRHTITRRLNAGWPEGGHPEPYPTMKLFRNKPRKAEWHPSTVSYIQRNRALIGEAQPGHYVGGKRTTAGDDPIPGHYVDYETGEACISMDLWDRAVAGRKSNEQKGGNRGPRYANLLSGLTRCAECSTPIKRVPMTYQNSREKKGYLKCNRARREAQCSNNRTFAMHCLEDIILDKLADHMLFVAAANPDEKTKKIEIEVATIKDLIHQAETVIRNIDLIPLDDISAGMSRRQKDAETALPDLKAKLAEATRRLEIERGRLPGEVQLRAIKALVATARSDDDKVAYDARAQINLSLKQIIDVVEFDYARKIDIIYGGYTRVIRIDADTWTIEQGPLIVEGHRQQMLAAKSTNPQFVEAEKRFNRSKDQR